MTGNIHGTNEAYRAARGTDQPFRPNPQAWAALRELYRAEKRAKVAGKQATPKGNKDLKPRKKRPSQKRPGPRGQSGRITVCSTEKQRQ